jgi:hypothetical protein
MASTLPPKTPRQQPALKPTPEQRPEPLHDPVLKVTRYDRVSAMMIALVGALVLTVGYLTVVWAANLPPAQEQPAPIELVDLAGGVEDGAVDETLQVDSPEPEVADASLAEIQSDEPQVEEMVDNVIDLAAQVTTQQSELFETDTVNTGNPGSATGTGRRALGFGDGESGIPREQRWFVRFSEGATIDVYARQLDYFGIQLAAILPNKTIVYLTNLKSSKPGKVVKKAPRGDDKKKLYMVWQGGKLKSADLKLFRRAGVDVTGAIILHLYPKKTEAMLAKLEFDFRKRKPDTIRRTYFSVRSRGGGFQFVVTRQSYFN